MATEYCQTCKVISIYDIMGQQVISVSKCSDSNENKLNTLTLTMCHWNDHCNNEWISAEWIASLFSHGSDIFLNNFCISLDFFAFFKKVGLPVSNIAEVVSQPDHACIASNIIFTSICSAELLILHVFPDFSGVIKISLRSAFQW